MSKVEVKFPDGIRAVPAHIEHTGYDEYGISRLAFRPRLTPDSISGWTFHQLLDGDWIAREARET